MPSINTNSNAQCLYDDVVGVNEAYVEASYPCLLAVANFESLKKRFSFKTMEEILHVEAPHTTVRSAVDILVLFTPGDTVFSVYTISNHSICQRSTEHPIVNVECSSSFIFVFHKEQYSEYDAKTYELLNTVSKPGITLKYMLGRSKFILVRGKDEMLLVSKDNKVAPVVQRIDKAGIVRGRYFFSSGKNGVLEVYESKKKVYSTSIPGTPPQWLDVKDSKLYCLQNGKITGHDLNIYLDELEGMTPSRFTNLENEIVLYDEAKKELRLYMKNMSVVLFSCPADDYIYDASHHQLFVLHGGELQAYRRLNECQQSFQLVTESLYYVENEDEFDESDSTHVDLHADPAAIRSQL